VELNYGRRKLPLALPNDLHVTVVRKPPMPMLPDPLTAVRRALQEPVGAASLDQLAKAARSATIAICDITRPVPNHLFLRPLIEIAPGRDPGYGHSHPGGDRPAPAQPGSRVG
jgi:nickel-dependent lactate racemase